MPIPWDKVILHGPQVLDVAKNLYGKWQTRPKQAEASTPSNGGEFESQFKSFHARLKVLEDAGEKQAALATELAEQTQALSIGITALKEQTERLKEEIEAVGKAHTELSIRFNELSTRLQQAEPITSALNRKITIALIVSIVALVFSAAALVKLFLQ